MAYLEFQLDEIGTPLAKEDVVRNIFNPLYFDGFTHIDKCNKDGIVHYIF